MEAHEVLYQRSLSFQSQAKLYAWIQRSRKTNLRHVLSITLRLTDVDLESLLEGPSSKRETRTSIWTLYKDDLQKLRRSLSSLPNLSRLNIIPPKIGHSLLLKDMYHFFLAEIPRRCPKLKGLTIDDSNELLKAVPALEEVHHVTFTTPISTAKTKAKAPTGSRTEDSAP